MKKQLRMLPTLLSKCLIQVVYRLCSIFKVNPNKITFSTNRTKGLTGNLAYIKKEIEVNYPDKIIIVLERRMKANFLGKLSYLFHMLYTCYHMATSRYMIVDDSYFPMDVVKPRSGTEYIQVWHAAGAFKQFGRSREGKLYGPSKAYLKHVPIHSNYSRVYVSSSEVIPYYAEAFGMSSSRFYPLGLPRTDFFFEEGIFERVKEKFFNVFPELRDKKLVLYAPTFRGKSNYQGVFNPPLNFSEMYQHLSDQYSVLVHLHPYMRNGLHLSPETAGFVHVIDDEFTIEELLIISDILITDYSSVIFDYSLLEKPIAFFAHDLEDYMKERDFYYDFEEMVPGPIFKDMDQLIQWVQNPIYDKENLKAFKHKFFNELDGKATERIVKHLFNH